MEKEKGAKRAVKMKRPKQGSEGDVSDDKESLDNNDIDASPNESNDSLTSDDVWTNDDDCKLVQLVKSTSKPNDKVSFKTRLKQLDWNKIAFKSYSAKDCEERFQNHLNHIRRHRNMHEIVSDIETNVQKCQLKKPLNSYQLFIQEQFPDVKSDGNFSQKMRNLAAKYKELSDTARSRYDEQAEQLRSEYKQKKDLSSTKIPTDGKVVTAPAKKPKTPFQLYAERKKLEGISHKVARENYANLSRDDKYKWIVSAVNELQDGTENVSNILNKEERHIYNGEIRTTPSPYRLYINEMFTDELENADNCKTVFAEIRHAWKVLKPKKKKIYTAAAAILKEKALEEQKAFNNRHGIVMPQKVKRSQSAVQPVDEVSPEPKRKRQKISPPSADASESIETKDKQQNPPPTPNSADSQKNSVSMNLQKNTVTAVTQSVMITSPDEINHQMESDNIDSLADAGSKKKVKKGEKPKNTMHPGKKPPPDLFSYFVENIHTREPRKAKKAFDKLTKKQRKHLIAEYNEKVEVYALRLNNYMKSISQDEENVAQGTRGIGDGHERQPKRQKISPSNVNASDLDETNAMLFPENSPATTSISDSHQNRLEPSPPEENTLNGSLDDEPTEEVLTLTTKSDEHNHQNEIVAEHSTICERSKKKASKGRKSDVVDSSDEEPPLDLYSCLIKYIHEINGDKPDKAKKCKKST